MFGILCFRHAGRVRKCIYIVKFGGPPENHALTDKRPVLHLFCHIQQAQIAAQVLFENNLRSHGQCPYQTVSSMHWAKSSVIPVHNLVTNSNSKKNPAKNIWSIY